MASDLVAIAKISKPRGLKGEVVADILTDLPERFADTDSILLVRDGSEPQHAAIERYFFQKGRIVLKLAGIDTIEAAEGLRDAEICVTEAETVQTGEDEFFDWQLEGCQVQLPDGSKLGEVTAVMRTGGTELLVVRGEREYLIPFARAICPVVDVETRVIKIDPPEGLLDL